MRTPKLELPKRRNLSLIGRVERTIKTESGPDLQVISYPLPRPNYRETPPAGVTVLDPDDLCAMLYERAVESPWWRYLLGLLDEGLDDRIRRMSDMGLGWQSEEGHRIMLIVHEMARVGLLGMFVQAATTITTKNQADRFARGWRNPKRRAEMRQVQADYDDGGSCRPLDMARRLAPFGVKLSTEDIARGRQSLVQQRLRMSVAQMSGG